MSPRPDSDADTVDAGSRPRHVVMVIQRFRPMFSGQGVQVEELCRQLARRGMKPSVVTAVTGSPEDPVERREGVTIHRLRCDLPGLPITRRTTRAWAPIFGLRTFLHLWRRRRRIDLIHVHALTDGLYGAWLFGRLFDVPVIFEMTLLGTDDPVAVAGQEHRLRRLRLRMYRSCDGYVAISPALAERYRSAGLPSERLRVIPQGVDTGAFAPPDDRRALRRRLELPTEAPLLLFVGSLIRRKGLDVLLEAWTRIRRRRPDARLLLVGRDRFPDHPEVEETLRRLVARLPEEASASLLRLGVRPALPFFQAADLFLFPSRREGFGTVMIEAMACELPCVVAELPGITDFIFERPLLGAELTGRPPEGGTGGAEPTPAASAAADHDGVVVPQDDAEALAEAALALLEHPSRRRSMGRAARRRVLDAFGFDAVSDRYLQWYGEVLGDGR